MKNELYSFASVPTPGFDPSPAALRLPSAFPQSGRVLTPPRAPLPFAPPYGGRAPAPRNPRNFGFFAYFRFFHLHTKICKTPHFFGHFSFRMYAIPHTTLKYSGCALTPPHGGRALALPLPTIPTQHPKPAKKPVFPRVLPSKARHSHTHSHSIVITRPLPKPILPYASHRWPCASTFPLFSLFPLNTKRVEKRPHSCWFPPKNIRLFNYSNYAYFRPTFPPRLPPVAVS